MVNYNVIRSDDCLMHYGMPRRSGRYPWGSGKRPYQGQEQPVLKTLEGKKTVLHENPKSATAKLLAKFIPAIRKNQEDYKDYTITDKEGKKLGTVSTNRDSDTSLNGVWLSIKDEYRGNGYAQDALKALLDNARAEGFKEFTLEVPGISPDARHIYEKLGFKETEILSDEDDIWGGLTKMVLKL